MGTSAAVSDMFENWAGFLCGVTEFEREVTEVSVGAMMLSRQERIGTRDGEIEAFDSGNSRNCLKLQSTTFC
jgi:hypothetical protein